MSFIAWTIILFLILVNAVYVAAEFAAVGVRRSQIHQLAEGGNSIAVRLLVVLKDAHQLDRYIAACQIGITFSSLVLGAYGQATIAADAAVLLQQTAGLQMVAAQSIAAVAVLIMLTALQVVFGELVPKSLALQYPTRMAISTYLPMRWSLALYSPFIAVLNGSGWLLLRALRVEQVGGHRHIHSPEEIDMLIAESRDGGLLEEEEEQRLHQALQLSRRTARQLMVPRRFVAAIDARSTREQVLQTAIESPYTRLPVYRESIDNVIGMLHTKHLAAHYARHGEAPDLRQLIRPICSVPSNLTADRLLDVMRQQRCRHAVVLDEFGGMEGLVSLEDVLTALVGAVADELKGDQPRPERLPDGRVRLPGLLRLDQAARWTAGAWPSENADTVGGCVLAVLGAVPEEGQRVAIDGMDIEVERMDGLVIASLLIAEGEGGDWEGGRRKAEGGERRAES